MTYTRPSVTALSRATNVTILDDDGCLELDIAAEMCDGHKEQFRQWRARKAAAVTQAVEEEGAVSLKPWASVAVVHVYPEKDRVEHRLGQECICQPSAEAYDDTDRGGGKGIMVVHKALDGRKN